MTVKDREGNELEITDLEKAIKQADTYRKYSHYNEHFVKVDTTQLYWQDLYEKLVAIKTNIDNKNKQ